MALSGTTDFRLDVDEVIEEAYSRLGHEPMTGQESRTAKRSLNLVLQDMINKGVQLHTIDNSSFSVTSAQATYTLGSNTEDLTEVYITRSSSDTELIRMSRQEFALLPDKTTQNRPSQFMLERKASVVNMTLWPVPDNSSDTIKFFKKTRIQDVNTSRDDIELPQRWYPYVCSELASSLALKREGIDRNRRQELRMDAAMKFDTAAGEESDRTSTFLVPG